MTKKNGNEQRPLHPGWKWTTIGEVTKPERNRVSPQDYPELPFIGMDDVESETMRLLGTKLSSEMKSSSERFGPDDVLYGSLRPYLNKVYRPDFEGLCSAEFIVFRKAPHLISKYLQYFLNQWSFVEFINRQNAGDRPRVKFEQMTAYPFPLAPLPEQERIVAEIEKQFTRLDTAVATLHRLQANLNRYKASVLKAACEGRLVPQDPHDEPAADLLRRILAERRAQWQAANPGKKYQEPEGVGGTAVLPALPDGWVWASIEQLADQRLGKMLDKSKNSGKLRPYLRNANVRWFGFDLTDVQELRATDDELDAISVINGDLVICEGGEPGRSAVWEKDEPFVIQKALHRVRPVSGISPWYLNFRLGSDANTGILEKYFTGSTIKHFTGQSLRSYLVPIPPSAEQHRIVAEVERRLSVVAATQHAITANLARANRLRQSILHRAFSGQLV